MSSPSIEPQEKNQAFLVVRSLKGGNGQQKGYKLAVNDIIRLGRMEYSVLDIQTQKRTQTDVSETLDNIFDKQFDTEMVFERKCEGQCKVCLVETEEQDNFLCSPCKCKGSCQAIHFKCLQKWMDSKIKKKSVQFAYQVNFKKFKCQICQQTLPSRIVKDGVKHMVFQLKLPQNKPFFILQSNQNKNEKNLFIIEATTEEIKIGRGHTCQVRITDISVSRTHALIKFSAEDSAFLLFDNNSKFGTLVKLSKNYTIGSDKLAIQVGRTVLTAVLRLKDTSKQKSKKNNFPSLTALKSFMK